MNIKHPMHTCKSGFTGSCVACYTETNAKKEYQKSLEHEPMHSCGEVTDEPCDACINEEEDISLKFKNNTEQSKNIWRRLQNIREVEECLYGDIANLKKDIEDMEKKLKELSEEKSQIIENLV